MGRDFDFGPFPNVRCSGLELHRNPTRVQSACGDSDVSDGGSVEPSKVQCNTEIQSVAHWAELSGPKADRGVFCPSGDCGDLAVPGGKASVRSLCVRVGCGNAPSCSVIAE